MLRMTSIAGKSWKTRLDATHLFADLTECAKFAICKYVKKMNNFLHKIVCYYSKIY